MTRYVIAPQVAWQVVAGEVVVVDLTSGKSFGLNRAASFLWTQLGSVDRTELVARMAARYSLSDEFAANDVSRFIEDMLARGVITGSDH